MAEKTAQETTPKKRCFMITPIGAAGSLERRHADWVWGGAIEPLFKARGYESVRADKIADPAPINDSIFAHIEQDEVCVADLTFLNANVFYELGVRHALGLPVIHIASEGTGLPFDNMPYRTIFFDRDDFESFESLKRQLSAQLDAIEEPGFKVSNPLTHARGRMNLKPAADTRDKLIEDLHSSLNVISRRLEKLETPPKATRNALLEYTSAPAINSDELIEMIKIYEFASEHGSYSSESSFAASIQTSLLRMSNLERLYIARQALSSGIKSQTLSRLGLQVEAS